ncbi:hypothetical protein [Vannielia litorea]|uniref:hypothetical protein n=1 Tax=Vannielia litorea TaxID=1217970 RepID=UPI001C98AC1A|nr:hypothetical protein [Vannielia litorea]MBY6047183.1 hypothetical protein [Vannielia litorea]MBY6074597.1 hypothetical protein [Vannielia litorea]
MTMQITIHAGFHKTGTTTLQALLRQNRTALSKHADIYLAHDMGSLSLAGRFYGADPGPDRRKAFVVACNRFLADLRPAPHILISRESLCGKMLGDLRVDGNLITEYGDVTVTLSRILSRRVQARFGPDARLRLVYTTRSPESLLRSAWSHNLRHRRLTDSFETFRAQFPAPPDLEKTVDAVRAALPGVEVLSMPLEEIARHRLGPAGPLLEAIGVPQDELAQFAPIGSRRKGQSAGLSEEILALNRTITDKATLRARKQALLLEREGIPAD